MSIEVLEKKDFTITYSRNCHSKGNSSRRNVKKQFETGNQSRTGEKVKPQDEDCSSRKISDSLEDIGPTTPRPLDIKDKVELKICSHIQKDDNESKDLDTSGKEDRRTIEDRPAFNSYEEREAVAGDKDSGSKKRRLGWLCINCTVSNLDDGVFCQACQEHRNSGILKSGFFAPAHLPGHSPSATDVSQGGGSMQVMPISASSSIQHVLSPLPIFSSSPLERLTAIGYDDRMLLHYEDQIKTPHPERPDRLRSIMAGLATAGLFPGQCFTIPPREATREELERVHSRGHLDAVEMASCKDLSYFTRDTYANKHSALAARLAAGICVDLATAVMKGQVQNGFAVVRPPGHHAEESSAMGFCLHNNVAVATKAALAAGAKKVLILDWWALNISLLNSEMEDLVDHLEVITSPEKELLTALHITMKWRKMQGLPIDSDVHHGNGTQEIFESDPSVLYISLHRYEGGKFYPGSGAVDEVGLGKGEGYSVNIPWDVPGIGDEDYLYAFQHVVLPIASQFQPDITIISAGFDAARGDPLGGCKVTPFGYAQMTQMLSTLAEGRVVVVLEGGYNLRSISASTTAVLKVLLGEWPGNVPEHLVPSRAGQAAVVEACRVHSQYWKGLVIPNLSESLPGTPDMKDETSYTY